MLGDGTAFHCTYTYDAAGNRLSKTDGRFISTDPSWFNDGANLYTYAYNDPINYIDLDGMKGDPTSLPTEHPKGSFLYNLTHLEEKFPAFNEKLNNADLKSNLPTNAPRIGSGKAPGIFKAMEKWVGKATPKGSGFGKYYSNGFKLAEKLYKDGTISTPNGTLWPPSYDHYYNKDKYIRELHDRFINTTDKDEQLEIVQKAKMRKDFLDAKEEAEKAKTQGGTNVTSNNTQSASSHDPNDKLATQGATGLHFVQDGSRLQYTVLFENDPENATAPARKVYVRDVMDANLDINSFVLHSFTLAGHTYQLPEGRDSFNGSVVLDLGEAGITVAVAINLDYETRELIASFTAIDPETGFELQDLTKGVLLVNDDSGRGEGNLNYSIQTLPDLPTDTQIHNTAEIFFDFNDPIETPTTLNTIDADAPGTASLTLSADDEGLITLDMSAEDVGAGVAGFNVRWSTDGEHFIDYGYTTYTQLQLPGQGGLTYSFQIQAVDAVGLTSEWSTVQSIAINGVPTDLDGTSDGLSWKPVPGAESYVVEYSTDAFEHFVRLKVTGTSLDAYSLPQATYQWRVRAAELDTWEYGEVVVAPQALFGPQFIQSNADGMLDAFFVNVKGTWNDNYLAKHVGVGEWTGTGNTVSLSGKNLIADIYAGSDDASVLLLTDGGIGDALFIDDVFSAFPEGVNAQARLAKIDEIRAGTGNDIVDMTSQRFGYLGDRMTIRGGLGDDAIWANKGNNLLFGDAGNDCIIGASGNDVIVGGSGNDTLHGGGGDDIFAFGGEWGNDTVKQLDTGKLTLWFKDGDVSKWDDQTLIYTDGVNSVQVSGVALENISIKFGDDNGNAIERHAALLAAGAFEEFTSEKIFEDKKQGNVGISWIDYR